jgi:hypothetical protein
LPRFVLLAIVAVLALSCESAEAVSSRPIGDFGRPASLPQQSRLLLSAKRLRPGGARFEVKVRLAYCGGRGGLPVQLGRNGKSFASKRLDQRCRARFWLTVAKPTPIRAFVRIGGEGERVRSRQLVLQPPRRP